MSDDGPVKVVVERRSDGADLETWTRELMASARASGALEGSSVLHRGPAEHLVLLRFAAQERLDAWRTLPDVERLIGTRTDVTVTTPRAPGACGLETWFTLPGRPEPLRPPPRWKMALVTWLALMPQVLVLTYVVPKAIPRLPNVALSTAIPVVLLTWVVMPNLTRLLHGWLYKGRATTEEATT